MFEYVCVFVCVSGLLRVHFGEPIMSAFDVEVSTNSCSSPTAAVRPLRLTRNLVRGLVGVHLAEWSAPLACLCARHSTPCCVMHVRAVQTAVHAACLPFALAIFALQPLMISGSEVIAVCRALDIAGLSSRACAHACSQQCWVQIGAQCGAVGRGGARQTKSASQSATRALFPRYLNYSSQLSWPRAFHVSRLALRRGSQQPSTKEFRCTRAKHAHAYV